MKKVSFMFFILSFFICMANSVKNDYKNGVSLEQFEHLSSEFTNSYENKPDPLKKYNEAMTLFNDKLYLYLLNPFLTKYNDIVPSPLRKGVSNFFVNLNFPVRFLNNLLQLKFKNSWEELQLFMLNSVFGIGGLINVAQENNFKIKYHHEDFGQTLAYWGVKGGFPIVLPFLGPSNLRDTLSIFVDEYIDPLRRATSTKNFLRLKALKLINETSYTFKTYKKVRKDAIYLYPYLKEYYNKKREKEIRE